MSEAPTFVASQRVVVGRGDDLQIVPACLELAAPSIAALQLLDEGTYAEHVAGLTATGATVHDYGERLLTPAFVNAHTHLALGFLRGFDLRAATRGNMVEELFFAVEGILEPEDVRAFARMGAYESLLGGVGLVWDHYYQGEQIAAALADVGLAGVVAPTLQDLSGPGRDAWESQLEATERIDEDEALRGRGVFAALGPHATDTVSASLWGRALDLAEARKLPVHAHLAQSLDEVRRVERRHGTTPVGWLERIGALERAPQNVFAHGIYASRGDLRLLSESQSSLIWCPFSALVFGFPARPGLWRDCGVPWAVATDCSSNNDTMNVQAELRLVAAQRTLAASWSHPYQQLLDADGEPDGAALVEAGRRSWQSRTRSFAAHEGLAEPADLLSRVWSIPGSLHPGFEAGVIERGALANFLVWDLNHPALWPALDPLHTLAMADAGGAIWAMYVAGRAVGEAGDLRGSLLRSDGYRSAQREASDRLRFVLERIADG